MYTIEISDDLLEKLQSLCREEGYDDLTTCLARTVERQLADIRMRKARNIAQQVRDGLSERGHTEEEVLRDFEAFRERLSQVERET